jgi:hypothetical protein
MEQASENFRLNLTSRLVLAMTVAFGLGVAVFSAPTDVAALGRAKLKPTTAIRTLSSAPGISLTRAYGVDDEDCVAVSPGIGATPKGVSCAR